MAVASSKYKIGDSGTFPSTFPINGDVYFLVAPIYFCTTDQYYYLLQANTTQASSSTYTVAGIATALSSLNQAQAQAGNVPHVSTYSIGQSATFPNTPPINGNLYPIIGPVYFCGADQYYYRLQTSISGGNITVTVIAVATSFAALSQS